jgi:hypothetical protein
MAVLANLAYWEFHKRPLPENATGFRLSNDPTPAPVNGMPLSVDHYQSQFETERKSHKRPKEETYKPSSKRPKHDDDRKDYWLHRNIIVRVVSKKLADGKYFKRKAIVDRMIDKYTAEVEVLDSDPDTRDGGDILRLDQDDLETVIPKEGKQVRILNGRERGQYLDSYLWRCF